MVFKKFISSQYYYLSFAEDSCVISKLILNCVETQPNQANSEIKECENSSSKDRTMHECECSLCRERNVIASNRAKEVERLRSAWIDVREQVWKVYHLVINNSWNDAPSKERPDLFRIKKNVNDLCARDPHQLYQRLETGVREFVLEIKLRLIELLQKQAKNPSLAQDFIQSEYIFEKMKHGI